jgi:uncharacterized protein YciI
MFIILLKFSTNKSQAKEFMPAHKEWIDQGMSDGVFLVVGNLEPNMGGGIVAHNSSLVDLRKRVDADPLVENNVVTAEILEISPSLTDKRLNFLLS